MIVHNWATYDNEYEYRDNVHALWCRNGVLYSYAEPIFKKVKAKNGELVVLEGTGRWSVTTSKHQSMGRHATYLKTVQVPCFHSSPAELDKIYCAQISELVLKSKRARLEYIKERHRQDAEQLLEDRNFYFTNFVKYGREITLEQADKRIADIINQEKAKAKRQAKKLLAEREALFKQYGGFETQSKLFKDEKKKLDSDTRYQIAKYENTPIYDFVRIEGSKLITTQGVTIDLKTVETALKLFDAGKLKDGEYIGDYYIRLITETQIVIGCHNIPMCEIDYIREVLNAR